VIFLFGCNRNKHGMFYKQQVILPDIELVFKLHTNLLPEKFTDSMEQSHSWEAKNTANPRGKK